jgi:endonuclease/exonuclease/phosphatase family metal-dependent hydrolase
MPFSIISYNLSDFGKSTKQIQRQQLDLIAAQRADVLCLQEIWDDGATLHDLHRRVGAIGQALGMQGEPAPSPESHCHLAILWQPRHRLMNWRSHRKHLWHGLGVAVLDIGARRPLRVGVTHLSSWDPDRRFADAHTIAGLLDDPAQASIVAGDWNSFGTDPGHDPEPDWSRLPAHKLWRRTQWSDDPAQPHRADRRPSQLFYRAGLRDAAPTLGLPWQATAGLTDTDTPRRIDAFWVSPPMVPCLRGYQVLDTPDARKLSDHLPIRLDVNPDALAAPCTVHPPIPNDVRY